MAKKKIKLTHLSNKAGASGQPGDVIECDEAIADRFIQSRGAVDMSESETNPTGDRRPEALATEGKPVKK